MANFEPIAIIGQGCVLPGALTPSDFWNAVLQGQDLTNPATEQYWGMPPELAVAKPGEDATDKAWNSRGGFVRDALPAFSASDFNAPPEMVATWGLGTQWCLYAAHQALQSAGLGSFDSKRDDVGLILGNLAYAPQCMTNFAGQQWLKQSWPDNSERIQQIGLDQANPLHRFSSGGPAQLTAAALGVGGAAYCLDAACASSLYAIKLACDQLQDGKANLMLAGAFNHADNLYLHVGFTALQALSKGGVSRPFDQRADGLIPGEGAAIVLLKRLKDAQQDGDQILGVIRGVGLSNDGRDGGFLSPSSAGQVRAIENAYKQSGLKPTDLSYLECHATGTVAGDSTELKSVKHVFANNDDLALASLKGNLGHLITAAGAAGLVRTLACMQHQTLAPSIHAEQPIEGFDSGVRLLSSAEAWKDNKPQIAGVNAFGFGGNNAHLIVQKEWREKTWPVGASLSNDDPIVICGVAVRTGTADSPMGLLHTCFAEPQSPKAIETIDVGLEGLGFPPSDLDQTSGQQLLVMELVRQVAAQSQIDPHATSVLVGMGTDCETSRFATRTRLAAWQQAWGNESKDWLQRAKDAVTPGITAAGVLGTMPNMPANRSNHQLDLRGPSFTVAAEELSGVRGLEIAQRLLKAGDVEAALVGAVDLSVEPVHEHALNALGDTSAQTDAACVLLLKRRSVAIAQGDNIVAELGENGETKLASTWSHNLIGKSHAASGLLNVALASLMAQHELTLEGDLLVPQLVDREGIEAEAASIDLCGFVGQNQSVSLASKGGSAVPFEGEMLRFGAGSLSELLAALDKGETSDGGSHRLALVVRSEEDKLRKIQLTKAKLQQNESSQQPVVTLAPGVFYSSSTVKGELGFVFTGAASAYPGMGREFFAAFPQAKKALIEKFPVLSQCQPWLSSTMAKPESEFAVLQGCSLLSQMHAQVTQQLLGIKPDAMLGVSSGETNSMYASGAWHDMGEMFAEIEQQGMYRHWISGDYQAARDSWNDQSVSGWRAYRVAAPVDALAELVSDQPRVFLTMINADNDGVIAGEAAAVEALMPALEGMASAVVHLNHDIIAHCPVMKSWEQPWRNVHHRQTQVPAGVRFYSNAKGGAYTLTRDSIADALTDQATSEVDFRPVVKAAYNDGVRIFVEHGPRQLCSQWVSEILGDQPHLSVHLDRAGAGLTPLFDAMAQLWCAGLAINLSALDQISTPLSHKQQKKTLVKTLPAHPPAMLLPELTNEILDRSMPPAPPLPPVDETQQDPEQVVEAVKALLAQAPAPHFGELAAMPNEAEQQVTLSFSANSDATQTLQNLHKQIAENHQRYLAFQAQAMQQLMAAMPQGADQLAEVAVGGGVAGVPESAFEMSPPAQQKVDDEQRPGANSGIDNISIKFADEKVVKETQLVIEKASLSEMGSEESFPGPKYNREQLEVLAGGRISQIFGPQFQRQDNYPRQVRMPEPPLLLADRVLGIDARPGAMEINGSIWTETDVTDNAWYVHHGHMPAGIMIESGQADLLLISWMGADFENKGERVYRLLGCELTYRDKLPAIGDTLRYDIHVDGYAQQGDVRLFFFHYDCEIGGNTHLQVRHGQAGFFTDDELANSAGVIWDAASEEPRADLTVQPGPVHTHKKQFSREELDAFTQGDLVTCFGEGFEAAHCHQRTPTVAGGELLMFDRVVELNHQGGPWQRGYIKAELDVQPEHWFFDGHFKNDPCMPGTLMFEGSIQVISFYLASMGFTLNRDGWRFEPVKDEAFKLLCRSQLIPGAKNLTYEIFVHGVENGTNPTIRVDLLCTVDGMKAFLGQGVGIELVPGWPVESRHRVLPRTVSENVAKEGEFAFDERSMVACAWGKPSHAFGPHYQQFDGPRRGPRLPGYPYHFISRIVSVDVEPRLMKSGSHLKVEYDVPRNAWYFTENSQPTMPFPVLLEAALQPCGWLATYIGGGFEGSEELFFRNLDGTATQHREVSPDAGCLTTEVKSTSVSKVGAMTVVGFEVRTYQGDALVYDMETVFGFFPSEALAQQAGLPATDDERQALMASCDEELPLKHRPAEFFAGSLRLPGHMLTLVDTISGIWPEGGESNKGRVRVEMKVDPKAWFFKAHFYGDPVQPGSLGLEMMQQALQCFAIYEGLGDDFAKPRFQNVANDVAHSWKYRGQVLPKNNKVICDAHITDLSEQNGRLIISASADLWVDGLKIYHADNMAIAIVEEQAKQLTQSDLVLDKQQQHWINHHCPTYTVPSIPMTCLADVMAIAAAKRVPGKRVVGFKNLRANKWLTVPGGKRFVKCWANPTSSTQVYAQIAVWDDEQYQNVAEGQVVIAEQYEFPKKAWSTLANAKKVSLPYKNAELFHGRAFQAMTQLAITESGSTALVDAEKTSVPTGFVNPGFLDACLHGIPHDNLKRWFPELADNMAAYPLLIESATFYGPTPRKGVYRVEARASGMHTSWHMPTIELQIIDSNNQLWGELTLVEAVMPKGPLGSVPPKKRKAFIVDREYDPEMRLSVHKEGTSYLDAETVRANNWLPGTLEHIYGSDAKDLDALTRDILIKEHLADFLVLHPSSVIVEGSKALALDNCLQSYDVALTEQGTGYAVTHQSPQFDYSFISDFWRKELNKPGGFEEDLFVSLVKRFVASVEAETIDALRSDSGKGVLYLANHQVGVESVLFNIVVAALRNQSIFALGKKEHQHSWIGRMLYAIFGDEDGSPKLLTLVDREDPQQVFAAMSDAMAKVAGGSHSMLVHAAGTRATKAGELTDTVSGALIDAALKAGVDIVPVRFSGGLPLDEVEERLEFPLGYGKQRIVLGKPIKPSELKFQNALEQKKTVLKALNMLDGGLSNERPCKPDLLFVEQVNACMRDENISETQAVLWISLVQSSLALSKEGKRMVDLLSNKAAAFKDSPVDKRLLDIAKIVFGRN